MVLQVVNLACCYYKVFNWALRKSVGNVQEISPEKKKRRTTYKKKEFLTGFRKRKLERKKKAQEELQKLLKEERKRIKQENKESYKKLVVSSRPIPDIEQLLQDEYEDEDVNVKIVELSSDTLQKKNLFIGENKPKESREVPKVEKKVKELSTVEIKGMGSDTEVEDGEDTFSEADDEDDKNRVSSKKDLKKILKKQATKKIQKSKVFQMKNKLERVKNKKKSHQKKEHVKKTIAKRERGHHGPLKKEKPSQKAKGKKTFGRRKH